MKQLSIFILSATIAVTASASVSKKEAQAMAKLGQGNTSEVDLAKIVEPKASNAEVKEFAHRMITDHSKGFEELEPLAKADKVTLKTGMDEEHKKFAAKLAKEKLGAPYDRTYMKQMVEDHKKDKSDIEKAIKETKNAELKKWEEAQLKTVEEHLKMAEEIKGKLK